MKKDKDKNEKSKIETDDTWNRVLYGTPTIGGFVVVGIILIFVIYKMFFD